jgi:hypothetical protein
MFEPIVAIKLLVHLLIPKNVFRAGVIVLLTDKRRSGFAANDDVLIAF